MLGAIRVDRSLAPRERWSGIAPFAAEARALVDSYLRDLGGSRAAAGLLGVYREAFLSPEHRDEIDAIARMIDRRPDEVLLANLYYDAFIVMMGCTAFGIDTPEGPLHARNLDWWTEKNMLSQLTSVCELSGIAGGTGAYRTVGWPGFVGVFSAVAEGRFAITLNAVVSDEPARLAPSIALLLRSVFDTAKSFDAAFEILVREPIAADCLLLLTGTRPGELVVIERTKSRAEIRHAENGIVVVTNDYRALRGSHAAERGELALTSCGRYDRALYLALRDRPQTTQQALAILRDEKIRMACTVQHMAMRAATGELSVELPSR